MPSNGRVGQDIIDMTRELMEDAGLEGITLHRIAKRLCRSRSTIASAAKILKDQGHVEFGRQGPNAYWGPPGTSEHWAGRLKPTYNQPPKNINDMPIRRRIINATDAPALRPKGPRCVWEMAA